MVPRVLFTEELLTEMYGEQNNYIDENENFPFSIVSFQLTNITKLDIRFPYKHGI